METAQATQNVPQQNSQRSTDSPQQTVSGRKRPSDYSVRFEDSPYYKMRAIVRDLRPHFIEVLKTPDFQNCKAAEEIREKMKMVIELYKEMIGETPISEECENVSTSHPSCGEIPDGQKSDSYIKPPEKSHTDWASSRHAENKSFFTQSISQKQQQPEGTYVVGGSAFGWNFITYPSTEVIYCGRTKESFRSANVKSDDAV